jgi:hypothetical protein
MGTNYYLKGYQNEDEKDSREFHIGKRSAASLYCFDCGVTLCKRGEENVHMGSNRRVDTTGMGVVEGLAAQLEDDSKDWHDSCPECGQLPVEETWENSTAGLELGFNKNPVENRTGVRSCSSFTFCRMEWRAGAIELGYTESDICIEDEYGKEFTIRELEQIIDSCPIHFTHLVGKEFS